MLQATLATTQSSQTITAAANGKQQQVVAFCGKPNVGKSALINALSGSRLRVGNWQGVTIERYEAQTKWDWNGNPCPLHLVDLPGLRDLSCGTQDQSIACNFLFDPSVAVAVNVVEAPNLQENLSLTLRLREFFASMGKPMIVALNFADELQKLGWDLKTEVLQQELGCPVVLVSARTKSGLAELKQQILQLYNQGTDNPAASSSEGNWQAELTSLIQSSDFAKQLQRPEEHGPWVKIVAENQTLLDLENVKNLLPADQYRDLQQKCENLKAQHQSQAEAASDSSLQYNFFEKRFLQFKQDAQKLAHKCLVRREGNNRINRTEKVDRLLLHPILGPFIGLFFMLLVFSITFSFADPIIGFVDQFFSSFLYNQVGKITSVAPFWLDSLIRDGIFTGLGLILSFTPLMLVLYILIGIMEESGYMVRIAFMADRGMARMGVSGRSLMPLFMGFGCNVPSIYATRTLESEGEKRITAFLAGFMSCGARMPVLGLFTATFLGAWAGFAVVCLYLLGIVVAVLVSLVLKRLHYFRSDGEVFVMDIPPYRWPLLSTLSKIAGFRTWSYVKRASTRILALLIFLWLFTFFPAHGDIEKSYAASFAKWAQPVFEPLGFGNRWQLIGAMPTAIVAKEGALAALGQFIGSADSGAEEAVPTFTEAFAEQGGLLLESLQQAFYFDIVGFMSGATETAIESDYGRGIISAVRDLWKGDPLAPMRSLSFAIFILLVIPCIVTLGALRQEFGFRFTAVVTGVYLVVPYIASLVFFQLSRLIFA